MMRYVMPTVLYTKVDALCDKLVTVIGHRTKLTMLLATVDTPWPNFSKSKFGTSFQMEEPLFLEIAHFFNSL